MMKKLTLFVFALGFGCSLAQASPWLTCTKECKLGYSQCISWATNSNDVAHCEDRLEVCTDRCNMGGH
jgi:hypothetical protein